MKGIWLENQELSFRSDIPIPIPSSTSSEEALIKVISAGICNTDLELVKGYYPYCGVLGHEFVGLVEKGPEHLINKRVVGDINATCGNCRLCNSGNVTHCENRTVLGIVNRNGAFADYLTLPVANLHVVPDSVPTDIATFTEPLAAALEIQEQIKIKTTDRVLVLGDGKLGLLVALSLSVTGCQLLAVGRHPEKLAILEAHGIQTALEGSVCDGAAVGRFDVSVDCTGRPEGFETARRALRPRGTLVMKSTYADKLTVDMSSIVVDEITLVGSRCGPFPAALDLLASGRLRLAPLIHASYPLSRGLEAFERARTKGTLKVLLEAC